MYSTDFAYEAHWRPWLAAQWPALSQGNTVVLAAPYYLPHPEAAGFHRELVVEPAGQREDWVKPLADGSRIHVHVMEDGSRHVHRDKHDPGRGVLSALKHFFTETKTGFVVLCVGAFAVVGGLGYAVYRGVKSGKT